MLPIFKTLVRHLKARHDRSVAIRTLSAMNDYQLSDIGIERGFVVDAVDGNLPLIAARTTQEEKAFSRLRVAHGHR